MTSVRRRKFKWRRFLPVQGALYLLFRYIVLFLHVLPYDEAIRQGKLLGRLLYLLDWKHRRVASENIRLAEGMPKDPKAIRRLVRRVYEHFGVCTAETLFIPRMFIRGQLHKYVKLEGFHHMDAALKKGRGAILLGAHLGNWELAGLTATLAGYQIQSIARPIENPFVDRYVNRIRGATGQRIIAKHDAVKAMVMCVRKNGILGILADQNARKNGIIVNFFGRPASTVRSPALMALKFGSPIVPLNTFRSGRNQHRFVASAPIEIPDVADREEAVRIITQELTTRLEEFVRLNPEQWNWLHSRWKIRPTDEEFLMQQKPAAAEAR